MLTNPQDSLLLPEPDRTHFLALAQQNGLKGNQVAYAEEYIVRLMNGAQVEDLVQLLEVFKSTDVQIAISLTAMQYIDGLADS